MDLDLEELTGIRATMLLADYVTVAEGKLIIIGAGWTVTGPGFSQFAIAILFEIPVATAKESYEFRLELIDSDGYAVTLPETETPILLEGQLNTNGSPQDSPGPFMNVPMAINQSLVQLPPDSQLEWRLSVDGRGHEDWRLPFSTRPATE